MSKPYKFNHKLLDRLERMRDGETSMDTATENATVAPRRKIASQKAQPVRDVRNVSPSEARIMLNKNIRNRPLMPGVVAKYAESMRRGEWKHSPEPISFDWHGNLLDGQHRLKAVETTGLTQTFELSFGWDPETFDVIGKGAPRGTGADLALLGYKNANHLHAVTRRMAAYVRAGYLNYSIAKSGSNGTVGGALWVSPQELLDFVDAYPPIVDSVQKVRPLFDHRMTRPTTISFAYALFAPFHDGTQAFLERVVSGLGLKEGDPAAHLHRRLIANLSAPKGDKLDPGMAFAYFVLALNRDAEGRDMKRLALPKNDAFPQPIIQPAADVAKQIGWPEPRGDAS